MRDASGLIRGVFSHGRTRIFPPRKPIPIRTSFRIGAAPPTDPLPPIVKKLRKTIFHVLMMLWGEVLGIVSNGTETRHNADEDEQFGQHFPTSHGSIHPVVSFCFQLRRLMFRKLFRKKSLKCLPLVFPFHDAAVLEFNDVTNRFPGRKVKTLPFPCLRISTDSSMDFLSSPKAEANKDGSISISVRIQIRKFRQKNIPLNFSFYRFIKHATAISTLKNLQFHSTWRCSLYSSTKSTLYSDCTATVKIHHRPVAVRPF